MLGTFSLLNHNMIGWPNLVIPGMASMSCPVPPVLWSPCTGDRQSDWTDSLVSYLHALEPRGNQDIWVTKYSTNTPCQGHSCKESLMTWQHRFSSTSRNVWLTPQLWEASLKHPMDDFYHSTKSRVLLCLYAVTNFHLYTFLSHYYPKPPDSLYMSVIGCNASSKCGPKHEPQFSWQWSVEGEEGFPVHD
jgi:hypothetical protein